MYQTLPPVYSAPAVRSFPPTNESPLFALAFAQYANTGRASYLEDLATFGCYKVSPLLDKRGEHYTWEDAALVANLLRLLLVLAQAQPGYHLQALAQVASFGHLRAQCLNAEDPHDEEECQYWKEALSFAKAWLSLYKKPSWWKRLLRLKTKPPAFPMKAGSSMVGSQKNLETCEGWSYLYARLQTKEAQLRDGHGFKRVVPAPSTSGETLETLLARQAVVTQHHDSFSSGDSRINSWRILAADELRALLAGLMPGKPYRHNKESLRSNLEWNTKTHQIVLASLREQITTCDHLRVYASIGETGALILREPREDSPEAKRLKPLDGGQTQRKIRIAQTFSDLCTHLHQCNNLLELMLEKVEGAQQVRPGSRPTQAQRGWGGAY